MPSTPIPLNKSLLAGAPRTTLTNNQLAEIERATTDVDSRDDFRDFITWRNNRCNIQDDFVGSKTVIDKVSTKAPVTLVASSYKLLFPDATKCQDFLLKTVQGKLVGFLSIKPVNSPQPISPSNAGFRIERLIAFNPQLRHVGTQLLQLAAEAVYFYTRKTNITLKAERFTQGDPSPVGFYYKEGYRSNSPAINTEIETALLENKPIHYKTLHMKLSPEGSAKAVFRLLIDPLLNDLLPKKTGCTNGNPYDLAV